MVNVADIAKAAFDGVAAAIGDAILPATLNGIASGRVVLGGDSAPSGFPMPTAKDKTRPAYLEGFSVVAATGDELAAGGKVYHVLGVRDIVEAGGLIVANVIAATDMAWTTATFSRKTRTSDGAGGYTEAETTLATATVGIAAMSGSERYASARIEATSAWQLWVKGIAPLTESDTVTVNGRTYAVTFVNDVELRGVWQVLSLGLGVAV